MKIWRRSLRTGMAAWLAGVAVLTVPLLAVAGTGVFEPHPTTPSFGSGYSIGVLLGDLDGDGDIDAVVANYGTPLGHEPNTVWLNDGTGNFSPHPTTPSFAVEPHFKAALGDLDGDADLDVIAADIEGERAMVWLNDGAGNFSAHPTTPQFATGMNFSVTLGDLDGDGDLDVITPLAYGHPEMVWLNDGAGNFSAHPETPGFGAGDSQEVALGDVDGDGDPDAVVANSQDRETTVWVNDGDGNFSAHPGTPSLPGEQSMAVALGDVDGDGDLDAIVANAVGSESAHVYLNDGDGNFGAHPSMPTLGPPSLTTDVALGDLDGDADLDVVFSNQDDDAETVWLNDGPAPMAVQLAGFAASAEGGHVRVTWETVSEQGNQGFNLLRGTSAEAPDRQLNETLIASEAPESSEGFSYEWVDTELQAGTTYYYWLEAVDTSGTTSRTGPVSATYEAPTAVTVERLAVSGGSVLPWWAGAAGLAVAIVGLCLRQRRA